ncbi:rRNA pseudouridine synthase [Helicobacter aurati]|uniref:Pseudouridine synthase n=1 Tax=Helicobacter aurati TaxID=137778 RepID=A0A3D8J602_9HELI|nr:pseudouridine synthase [Helicobacter aurati]RDU72314.1 rRNA pseudouridine synthase [Helicobacter aurati]
MRLNHFIALHSKYSRRESDKLIETGRVRINQILASRFTNVPTLAIQNPREAQKDFRIFIDGKLLNYVSGHAKRRWSAIVYHKKKGELVSKVDPRGRPVIYDSLDSKYAHFMPVGRLDFASEGLLILSDNREVVRLLMESSLKRVYLVKIDSVVHQKIIDAMTNGLSLKNSKAGGHALGSSVSMDFPAMDFQILKNGKFSKLKLSLNQGRNREIRRFFAHFRANVLDLKRVSYGFVSLNALPLGTTRFFTKDEYRELKNFMSLQKSNIEITIKNNTD